MYRDKRLWMKFHEYLSSIKSTEGSSFLCIYEDLFCKKVCGSSFSLEKIYQKFISSKATHPLNISYDLRQKVEKKARENTLTIEDFFEIRNCIMKLLYDDAFFKFLDKIKS